MIMNGFRKLRHPNIVQFLGIAKLEYDSIGVVMELCETDLNKYANISVQTRSGMKQVKFRSI